MKAAPAVGRATTGPARFARWRVIGPVAAGTALSLLGDTSLYTVLPTHAAEAGMTLGALGLLLSANRWVRLGVNAPAGWLTDHWPRRRVFVPALFVGALSTAIYAVPGTVWLFLVGRLLWGVAWAGIWVAGNAIVLDVSTGQNRGRNIGLYNVSFFLGAASGALVGGWLTDLLGFHQAMLVESFLGLLGAMAALIVLPETSSFRHGKAAAPGSEKSLAAAEGDGRRHAAGPPKARLASAFALLGVNRLVMAGIVIPTFGLYLQGLLGDTVVWRDRELGIATVTGLALSASTLMAMLSVPLTGALSDIWRSRWRVASGSLLPGVVGLLLLAQGAVSAVFFGLPVVSMTSGSGQVLASALTGDMGVLAHGGTRQARYQGWLFTVGDLASAVGPLLAFYVIARADPSLLYAGCALLLAAMALIAHLWALRDGSVWPAVSER